MLSKRIIPCLDVKEGKVVKGINFVGIKEVGDPVQLAKMYNDQQADELVFLDITASHEHRKTMVDIVEKVASSIFIPFTVGGGISSTEDMKRLLRAGADKISINSAAVKNPQLIKDGATLFGSQCIVLAIDAKEREDKTGWNVVIHGGRIDTGIDLLDWVKQGLELGAGEILLTSMDTDGCKQGYDLKMLKAVNEISNVPVIASGGAGSLKDFSDVFEAEAADAALAASLFHYEELTISDVKKHLKSHNIPVRL